MTQTKRSARSEVTRIADLVRKAVDDGAKTAEDIHKSIADLPLDVLERLDVFQKTTKDVRRIQETSIGAVYDLIRRINKEVTGLAAELAAKPKRARKPARRPAAKKAAARKPARAAAGA